MEGEAEARDHVHAHDQQPEARHTGKGARRVIAHAEVDVRPFLNAHTMGSRGEGSIQRARFALHDIYIYDISQ